MTRGCRRNISATAWALRASASLVSSAAFQYDRRELEVPVPRGTSRIASPVLQRSPGRSAATPGPVVFVIRDDEILGLLSCREQSGRRDMSYERGVASGIAWVMRKEAKTPLEEKPW
jgi:hypothetical protein